MTTTSIAVSTIAAATTDELTTGWMYAGALVVATIGFMMLLNAVTLSHLEIRDRALRAAAGAGILAIIAVAPYILADFGLVSEAAASAVSWLGGVLTTLAVLVSVHYATTPPAVAAEQATP